MIPIPVFWTKYTATMQGRVLKVVPCENCSTEYVYILERKSSGVGTSVYMLNEEGAAGHAQSGADDPSRVRSLRKDRSRVPLHVAANRAVSVRTDSGNASTPHRD